MSFKDLITGRRRAQTKEESMAAALDAYREAYLNHHGRPREEKICDRTTDPSYQQAIKNIEEARANLLEKISQVAATPENVKNTIDAIDALLVRDAKKESGEASERLHQDEVRKKQEFDKQWPVTKNPQR